LGSAISLRLSRRRVRKYPNCQSRRAGYGLDGPHLTDHGTAVDRAQDYDNPEHDIGRRIGPHDELGNFREGGEDDRRDADCGETGRKLVFHFFAQLLKLVSCEADKRRISITLATPPSRLAASVVALISRLSSRIRLALAYRCPPRRWNSQKVARNSKMLCRKLIGDLILLRRWFI
jgi:hypothetical protein